MDKIIVVGAGTMGAGIAFVAARAGYAVDLVDPDAPTRARAVERIRKEAERAKVPEAAGAVTLRERLPDSSDAGLAIEAVPERLELKLDVFRALESVLDSSAILASNTSSLSIDAIAAGLHHPERILGLHFFNPPAAMKLVEIVHGEQTSDEALAHARAYVERFAKTAVLAADTPGFIVNRVARPFYLQAMRAYVAGVAPPEDLDRLARGAGFRMGPFELMDFIGLDINFATSESIYARTGARRLEPLALQAEMVGAGRLGRKSGSGFFDYANGAIKHDDEPVAPADSLDEDERVVVLGFGSVAREFEELLAQRYATVSSIENDEFVDEIGMDTTIVVDAGDGVSDRSEVIRQLDTILPPEAVIFVDAYATDIEALTGRLKHPERIVGYGVLGTLAAQRVIEIVDAEKTGDDALELAQELFESIGKDVVLVEDTPALFLGRTVGSIINEAIYAVQEDVASADDIDIAMRQGTNYPIGPIAWGREIGGKRVARILHRLAKAEGDAFAPHRAIWVLDAETEDAEMEEVQP
ncbi:MAG TPA: 3-hydroxyacyl-CoA dehydrogenase NAD-binding domain-containing protein [Candidatus Baltobacteraceae bacterium]